MNELHQLVRDVMLKEFGDSRNSPLKARPTTALIGAFRESPNSFNITSLTSWCNLFISRVTSLSSSFSASVRGVGLFYNKIGWSNFWDVIICLSNSA